MFLTILSWICLFISGLIIGLISVVLLKVKTAKKVIFNNVNEKKGKNSCFNAKVDEIVKRQRKIYKKKNRFHVFKTVIGLKTKTKGYFAMYGDIIKEVAKLQNPDSERPFLEFTISQAFEFVDKVTIELEDVLDSLGMPMLKNVDVGTMYGLVDFRRKINELKAVKIINKITKPLKPFIKIIKLCNPVKWVVMVITAIFTASLTRDLIFAAADILALEFDQFYKQCKNERLTLVA